MIVCPTLTCPSPAMTTWPSWRTLKIVVCRNSTPGSIPLSDSWEGTSINLFQMIHADVSIALRRRQARMTEHFLYRPQIRSITKHMRCERVTQPVRSDAGVDAGGLYSALQNHLDAARGQPSAAKIRDDGTVVLPRDGHRSFPLFSASRAGSPSGTRRSLLPLPARTITMPSSSSISRQLRPTSSPTRRPDE